MNVIEHAVSESPMSVELRTLLRYLNAQRAHALAILEGLDDSVLEAAHPAVGLDLPGTASLQHLALDVERFWFRAVVAGEQTVIDGLAGASDAWQVGADVPAEAVFDKVPPGDSARERHHLRHVAGHAAGPAASISSANPPVEHVAGSCAACHDRNCLPHRPSRRRP